MSLFAKTVANNNLKEVSKKSMPFFRMLLLLDL